MRAPEHSTPFGRFVPAIAAALLLLVTAPASAVLGESIGNDPRAGVLGLASQPGVSVHVQHRSDGSVIRQFVDRNGIVFAVAWNTRTKPRLDELLGTHFGAFVDGVRSAQALQPGARHRASVRRGDLVVEASAYLQSHVGRAYLRSRVPTGTPLDALR